MSDTSVRAVASQLIDHPIAGWFYGDSIGFEGLLAAGDLTSDSTYVAFARGFLRGWAARSKPYRELDNTVPGVTLVEVVRRTDDRYILASGVDLARFLADRPRLGPGLFPSFSHAPLREPYGGEALPPDERALLADPGPGVYVDCLHFDPPFFAHLGQVTGDAGLTELAVDQALGYVTLLQDPASGLFRHFWLDRTHRPYVLGWSRGQGWALLGLLDVLEAIPAGHPRRPDLVAAARGVAGAMLATQRPDGHWCALATDADQPIEASAAAFMATGFARGVHMGILERPFAHAAQLAWRATRACLQPDGALSQVSAAVWSSTRDSHYRNVSTGHVVPWGQGPVLTAALAISRL